MKRILIVEDEPDISMVLKRYLERAEFEVEQADDGEKAILLYHQWKPSLVLLDVMLPDIDGWTILKHIRSHSSCPVIMLTALNEIGSRLGGLNAGADDYISKPFIADEVVARVKAVLRRWPQVRVEDTVLFGGLKIDFGSREVFLNGRQVRLPPRDLSLLLFFADHPNQSFDREQLISAVWGMDYEGIDRAVDLAVGRIRQALADWSGEDGEIETMRGLGYKFRVKPKA
ncbi:response regulator transcription factor [Paenibacillus mesophilus]|uniref:response regulator transcription factor n=1 Tax=Paenibacillus mesophilus TaxID=2582849 RepID=UPI00110DD85F|nr:response regulator transcription factor [Paenibacillus mesophilus]TMV48673.1 response regulator transcription factor [Paenibacillus mesophilus]